jgi:hypothetical protein
MRAELHNPMTLAAREERSILDEIRNDRELIERLKITPQELEALSKCALLGTLSCKDDMLFILRQIREATSAASSLMLAPPDFSECPSLSEYQDPDFEDSGDEDYEAALPALPKIRGRIAPLAIPEALDENARRPLSRRVAAISLVVTIAAAASLLWEGVIAISRPGGSFMTSVGVRLSQAASAVWFNRLDRFGVLLLLEGLLVAGVIAVICLRSLRGFSRLKVMPGWRY